MNNKCIWKWTIWLVLFTKIEHVHAPGLCNFTPIYIYLETLLGRCAKRCMYSKVTYKSKKIQNIKSQKVTINVHQQDNKVIREYSHNGILFSNKNERNRHLHSNINVSLHDNVEWKEKVVGEYYTVTSL